MEPTDPRLTLGRFLRQVAELHGDRPAIRCEARTQSYRELESEARALARGLIGAGVVKGAHVAVLMSNRPEWVVSAFAVGMLGGVVVPVNTFAERDELAHILRHGDASLLLLQPSLLKHRYVDALLDAFPEIASGVPGRLRVPALPQLRRVVSLGPQPARGGVEPWDALLAAGNDVSDELLDRAIDEVEPSDDALVIYTSGTTAAPKGVVHTHRATALQAWRFRDFLCLTADDRVYTTYPFFWTAGIAMSLGGTLVAGGCLLIQEHFDPGEAIEMIERERATVVHAWPHQQKALGEHPSAAARDLSSVQKVDFTSPLAKLAGIPSDVYGVGSSYGLSETFTITSGLRADTPAEEREACNGVPWPGMDVHIVDPETGELRGPGEEGEIAVRGVSLMRGYHKVLREQVLDPNGYFRTQDGGSLDAEGRLHWSGRLSNLIKTGGANVSPIEIQELLAGHPDVKVGIAVGVGHPTLGEVVVLCAVPIDGATLDEDVLRAWLRERLAAYKVPRRILSFRSDELQYTGNQKVQVGPLREAALGRLEAEGADIDGHRYGPQHE